ncbi:MAG: TIGR01459 family HAD-type hydrolase [Alphaproteobacteria bacterium]|nr:TIGR01459 family HAD-type hydrolase [Alphaproteobacteria bacterium]
MALQNTAGGTGMPKFIKGMEDVAPFYQGFIFDLWGCVHDGVKPFAGTAEVLFEMKRAHRKVWLLSNAPRRAQAVAHFLADMGIAEDGYAGIMTSGEAVWHALKDKYVVEWGRRCLHIGTTSDRALYGGLGMELVDDIAQADMIVCTGMDDGVSDPAHYNDVLKEGAARGVPMICANPDRIVHVGEKLIICPGTQADMYAALNGKVVFFGKPYREVYRSCLDGLGVEKVLAVGDGMPTDIAGAAAAGLDSVLITSGIHRDDVPQGPAADGGEDAGVEGFLRSWPVRPDYLLEHLRW